LNVLAFCFLPVPVLSQTYPLAILHLAHTGRLQLLVHDLSIPRQELSIEPSEVFNQVTITEVHSCALVPIPASKDGPAGLLVLGGQTVLFFEVGDRGSADKGQGKVKRKRGRRRPRKTGSSANNMSVEPRAQTDWVLSDLAA